MIKHFSFILLAVLAWNCAGAQNQVASDPDIETLKAVDWEWKKVDSSKVESAWASVEVFGSTQSISIARFPIGEQTLSVVDAGGPAAEATSTLAAAESALAAINGSYFNMETLWPTTFLKDEGKVVCNSTEPAELRRCNGIIRMDDHKIDILSLDTLSYQKETEPWREAMVAGPVLIEEGKVLAYAPVSQKDEAGPDVTIIDNQYYKKFYEKRHPRTMVGYTADGWVYFIVVDGRFPEQGEGMKVSELQKLSIALGLYECLNLDGGGSSTLWVSGEGVLNHPYDNKVFDHAGERAVPNILIVK